MRFGVFGGTFDPVHLGHLILAEQCREQARLDRVLFVLAPRPPHKLDQSITPFHHRLEMLELAIAGYPAFQISQIERNRDGPSYTVDTLRELRQQQPGDEFSLMIGSDTLADLPNWREPVEIAKLTTLLVAERTDSPADLPLPVAFKRERVRMPLIQISSSDIRERVCQGRSIRYLTPRAVECYIATHRLYRASS
jgi:nicotinate-nucleotide adenylyltransferase